MSSETKLMQIGVVGLAGVLAIVVGTVLFYQVPETTTELLGILLVVLLAVGGIQIGSSFARSLFPAYNVAEVAVEGPITRDGPDNQSIPTSPTTPGADAIVEQIDRANADESVDALLVKLNTPGGEVVPSDDIRRACERFDGPTIAYTTDLCASGGYWIASGCDELWAREASIVGSIGVIGSRFNVSDLADRLGISYERFVAGDFKDAGTAFRDLDEAEREYLQSRIDGLYDQFVDQVADGRNLDESMIRDTEARIYLGTDALELGLVDELGTQEDIHDQLHDQLGADVVVEEFAPQRTILGQFRTGASQIAYAFGAGIASVVAPGDRLRFR